MAASFGTYAKASIMIHPLVVCFVDKLFVNILRWCNQKEGGHERIQDTELAQVPVRPLSPPQLHSFWDNHPQLLS